MEYVTSWERKGIALGLEQGLQQGRLAGQLEALQTVLLDLLAWRFGTIEGSVKLRVATIGSIDDLRGLTQRAMVAGSLKDLDL